MMQTKTLTLDQVLESKELAWLALALTPKVGPANFLKLLTHFGHVPTVLMANRQALSQVVSMDIAMTITQAFMNPKLVEIEQWLQKPDTHIILLDDDDYPLTLANISQPPPVLFGRGQRAMLTKPMIAMVGSRSASPQGLDNARWFARQLGEVGVTVVDVCMSRHCPNMCVGEILYKVFDTISINK
jgi:DNA processing protein